MLDEDQAIHYAELGGVSVAWSSVGSGPPLVLGGWWLSHLELDWKDAAFRRLIGVLAAHREVIRYDRPGTGLSDRTVPANTDLASELAMLSAVIDHVARVPVSLLGASTGCAVAASFAALHPDRVDRLVLYGGYTAGRDIAPPAARAAMLGVIDSHWGLGSRVLSDIFLPGSTAAERIAFAELQRSGASREVAHASLEAVYSVDAGEYLAAVSSPTMVIHRRGDRAIRSPWGASLHVVSRAQSLWPSRETTTSRGSAIRRSWSM